MHFIQKNICVIGAALLLTFTLACKKQTAPAEAASATSAPPAPAPETVAPKTIQLSPDQLKAVNINMQPIVYRQLAAAVKVNGYTAVPPQYEVQVSPLIEGMMSELAVREGMYVKKGARIATLQNLAIIQMQEDLATAQANAGYLQQEYERQQQLAAENISAKKVLQEVSAKLAVEQARIKAARARLQALHIPEGNQSVPVYAPISGYVTQVHSTKGAYIQVGSPIVTLIDPQQMIIELQVFEKDLMKVREGQTVEIALTQQQTSELLKATVKGINKQLNNDTKTVTVYAQLQPSSRAALAAGMFVQGNILTERTQTPTLPSGAIVKIGEKNYIFQLLKKDDKTASFIPVEVGIGTSDMGYTALLPITPLAPDAQYVTHGAFYLHSIMIGVGEDEE